jgi:hypothetical protein
MGQRDRLAFERRLDPPVEIARTVRILLLLPPPDRDRRFGVVVHVQDPKGGIIDAGRDLGHEDPAHVEQHGERRWIRIAPRSGHHEAVSALG